MCYFIMKSYQKYALYPYLTPFSAHSLDLIFRNKTQIRNQQIFEGMIRIYPRQGKKIRTESSFLNRIEIRHEGLELQLVRGLLLYLGLLHHQLLFRFNFHPLLILPPLKGSQEGQSALAPSSLVQDDEISSGLEWPAGGGGTHTLNINKIIVQQIPILCRLPAENKTSSPSTSEIGIGILGVALCSFVSRMFSDRFRHQPLSQGKKSYMSPLCILITFLPAMR